MFVKTERKRKLIKPAPVSYNWSQIISWQNATLWFIFRQINCMLHKFTVSTDNYDKQTTWRTVRLHHQNTKPLTGKHTIGQDLNSCEFRNILQYSHSQYKHITAQLHNLFSNSSIMHGHYTIYNCPSVYIFSKTRINTHNFWWPKEEAKAKFSHIDIRPIARVLSAVRLIRLAPLTQPCFHSIGYKIKCTKLLNSYVTYLS